MSRTSIEELDNRKALVLELIYERTNRGAHPARLSYREIAQHAGCSQGCAINCMKRLVSEGLVIKRPCFSSDGGQRGNVYVLKRHRSRTNRDSGGRRKKTTMETVDGTSE